MDVEQTLTVVRCSHLVSTNEIADVLERAASILEVDGWCKGHVELNGRYCAVGAIRKAATGSESAYDSVALAAQSHIQAKVYKSLPAWNDAPARQAYEVIDLFKKAAKDLRNEAEPV